MNPKPEKGQRWFWKIDGSSTIIEITSINQNERVGFVYVQIITKGFPQDIVGGTDYTFADYMVEPNWTYLPGQDRS